MRKSTPYAVLRFLPLVLLACLTTQAQRTTHVPADASTIQSAIDASSSGDTILVSPGTYFENLDLRGKAITLQSTEGPETTILDGSNLAPVVTFATRETRATSLSGFTLRNGAPASTTSHGGGILLVASSPTIAGNILTHNLCTALDATQSSPLLTRNILRETHPSALCIAQPVAPVVFSGGSPTLLHNIVEHNDLTAAQPISAGIALTGAQATLQSNILRENLTGNDAPSAIFTSGTQPIHFEQNLINANSSHCGPAVSIASPGTFLNNTVADNATCDSSAELTLSSPQLMVVNNILATSSSHPALACSLEPAAFHHNLLHNASGPVLAGACPDPGTNLFADPLFANRVQADYHLSPHSPALAEGTTAFALAQHDLDDILRIQDGRIDLGPYEHALPKILTASTIILNATPSPAEAFQSITLTAQVTAQNATPTGSIVFTANSQPLATLPLDTTGRASFTTTALPAATLPFSATYSGSATIAPSSDTLTQRIAPATTLLSFAVTPSTADETQSVTLSATVAAPLSTRSPTGQVQFLELTTHNVLATLPLDPTGHASATLPTLPNGTWLIDAIYLGSANFSPVTLPASNALTLTIANRGYVLSTANQTITIQSGHHAPVPLTLASIGTFAATLILSCANLPANATCTFSPASPSLTAGSTLPVTLTLDTDAIPGFLALTHPAAGPTLAFLLVLTFKRRRQALSSLCLLTALTGCTSQYPAQVPSGTYPIQVVSQAVGSSTKQTLSLIVVVTN
ncbi:Right handed beta helix region [Granulicella pectinivorans]|uniref:Right handed beta helix region n=1 Tax=Granulicella pectinivorans TaxID=474950 RepID=A0A1I6L238_9BACT|nr:Ig-like domain repeat protein [Granulicella pectinivorans]SFR97525.1 Right handed beta helix region [Granulicella pectinivorans]